MIKLENLELVEVIYEDSNKKVTLVFLDEINGEIREVNFNKRIYDNGVWKDDAEKEAKVDEWCSKYFNLDFNDLQKAVHSRHDIYAYDSFSSLWEVQQNKKFTADMVGNIYQTSIADIKVDDYFIKICYYIDGDLYESKQTFGKYMEDMKKWFKDPVRERREKQKFYEKYGVEVDRSEVLIGKEIMVEVKCAFNKYYYGDIKKFPKKGNK